MRVNVYAEEMTDRIALVEKEGYVGLRIYLELPVTMPNAEQVRGPFIHRRGDDDSSAVTFWGKRDLRPVLHEALAILNNYYANRCLSPRMGNFEDELAMLLNKHNFDAECGVPDHILAGFIDGLLVNLARTLSTAKRYES